MAYSAADLIPGLPEEVARDCLLRVHHQGFPSAKSVCRHWRNEIQSPAFHRLRNSTGLSRTFIAMVQAQQYNPSSAKPRETTNPKSSPAPTTTTTTTTTTAPAAVSPSTSSSSSPFYRLVLLDPSTSQWSLLPPVPSHPHGLPLFCQVAASSCPSPSLILLGGWDPSTWAASDAVWVYDFLSARWRRGAPIPAPRRSFFACASDGAAHVYVAGGHDEEKNAMRSALRYDVAADTWDRLPDMAGDRDECKGVFRDGRFCVLGGYSTDTQGQFCRSAETLDVETLAWGPVDEDALGGGAAGASGSCPRTCAVAGNKMFRCRAGRVEAREGADWGVVAEVPEGARVAPWVVAVGDRMIMLVGSACHGGPHESYLLDVASGKWNRLDVPDEYTGHVQAGCCIDV